MTELNQNDELDRQIQEHAEKSVITIVLDSSDEDCGLPSCHECNDLGALGG